MQDAISIRILEKTPNDRGDLFARLMADLFVALGYDKPDLNIHKPGRELDISTTHRLEPRRAIGECKATSKPVGGDDLNKFVGVLDAEQRGRRPVTGYFISLSGFTVTAIEQEKRRSRTKIVTLSGSQVVDELVKGRIVVARDRATEIAGRCCPGDLVLTLDPQAELLAHRRGWIWAIRYTQGGALTHFVLVHSDGTPLARVIADEVIAADRKCRGGLHKLTCLNPMPPSPSDSDSLVAEALAAYRQYLENECGYIQLDGLPADSDAGSRRLRLESLFVPLCLDVAVETGGETRTLERQTVGAVLAQHPRLALLAAPGGGKSTLVRRLAIAYADPARREQIADELPSRNWLPLLFRCRELRGLARGSFAELLEALSQRELVRQHAGVFRAHVDRELLAGRVLLLVDGLDEISDPGDRAAFVCTLRTALHAYPSIAMVVTSREAGFRHIAAHLAPVCTHATLSAFNPDDIRRLIVAWHREVVGTAEKVQSDAEQLARTIVRNDRINRVATNPLLLTTLLLVKRWVGSLPTRRALLYGKAVEVLLMTWNVEAHEPIPEEEAMPQLCYVASGMMLEGQRKISRPHLAELLHEAREALPAELAYAIDTVDDFIKRVEERSSLLMMSGHEVENGRLVESFEFRHLTFQEYLTARAMVQGWHRKRKDTDTLVTVLEPHFEKEDWREVIPLAAVLGGKATEELIQRLTQRVTSLEAEESSEKQSALLLALGSSLADEAVAHPDTVRTALHALVRTSSGLKPPSFLQMLARGKYGGALRDEAQRAFLTAQSDFVRPAAILREVVWWQNTDGETDLAPNQMAQRFIEMLSRAESLLRCEGALGCAALLRRTRGSTALSISAHDVRRIGDSLVPLLFSENSAEQFAAAWGLYEVGLHRVWAPTSQPDALGRMFVLWQRSAALGVRINMPSTIASQIIAPREDNGRCASIKRSEFAVILDMYKTLEYDDEKPAALVVAWYLRALSDEALVQYVRDLLKSTKSGSGVDADGLFNDLLQHLGESRKGGK